MTGGLFLLHDSLPWKPAIRPLGPKFNSWGNLLTSLNLILHVFSLSLPVAGTRSHGPPWCFTRWEGCTGGPRSLRPSLSFQEEPVGSQNDPFWESSNTAFHFELYPTQASKMHSIKYPISQKEFLDYWGWIHGLTWLYSQRTHVPLFPRVHVTFGSAKPSSAGARRHSEKSRSWLWKCPTVSESLFPHQWAHRMNPLSTAGVRLV